MTHLMVGPFENSKQKWPLNRGKVKKVSSYKKTRLLLSLVPLVLWSTDCRCTP